MEKEELRQKRAKYLIDLLYPMVLKYNSKDMIAREKDAAIIFSNIDQFWDFYSNNITNYAKYGEDIIPDDKQYSLKDLTTLEKRHLTSGIIQHLIDQTIIDTREKIHISGEDSAKDYPIVNYSNNMDDSQKTKYLLDLIYPLSLEFVEDERERDAVIISSNIESFWDFYSKNITNYAKYGEVIIPDDKQYSLEDLTTPENRYLTSGIVHSMLDEFIKNASERINISRSDNDLNDSADYHYEVEI